MSRVPASPDRMKARINVTRVVQLLLTVGVAIVLAACKSGSGSGY